MAKKRKYKLSLVERRALRSRRVRVTLGVLLVALVVGYGVYSVGFSREYVSEVVTGREIREIGVGRTEVALGLIIPNSKQVKVSDLPEGQKSDLVVHGKNRVSGSFLVERYAVYETKKGYEVYGKYIDGTRTYAKVEGENATYLKMALYE